MGEKSNEDFGVFSVQACGLIRNVAWTIIDVSIRASQLVVAVDKAETEGKGNPVRWTKR